MDTSLHSSERRTALIGQGEPGSAPVERIIEAGLPPLFEHQRRAVEFILERGGTGALFMDMGTGKTRAAIESFARLRAEQPDLRMVVICPLSLIESAWIEDVKKFSDFTCYNAHEDGLEDVGAEDIVLINFEAAIQSKNFSHLCGIVAGQMLVIDESSRMKNHKSKTTKLLLNMRHTPKFKIIMSGTPAPNSPTEYWAQMDFLQPGVLESSFNKFRNTYFHLGRGNQQIFANGKANPEFISQMLKQRKLTVPEANLLLHGIITKSTAAKIFSVGARYEITKDSLAAMMAKINPLVFWAKKEDCLDLPDEIDEVRQVDLGPVQARHYRQMKNDLITEIQGKMITAQAALTKAMKLREITSGFAFTQAGEAMDLGECPKMKELEAVLDESGGRQVIIWAVFRWDIGQIVRFLEARYGQGCAVTLYSGTHDPQAAIGAFKVGMARFLVANPASGGHGLTFTNCSLQVFFSMDYSWERYVQAKARIHRAGQVNKCTYVHLLAKDTIDEEIYRVLRNKGDINEIAYKLM